jgi:hypothetical protein
MRSVRVPSGRATQVACGHLEPGHGRRIWHGRRVFSRHPRVGEARSPCVHRGSEAAHPTVCGYSAPRESYSSSASCSSPGSATTAARLLADDGDLVVVDAEAGARTPRAPGGRAQRPLRTALGRRRTPPGPRVARRVPVDDRQTAERRAQVQIVRSRALLCLDCCPRGPSVTFASAERSVHPPTMGQASPVAGITRGGPERVGAAGRVGSPWSRTYRRSVPWWMLPRPPAR